MPDVRVSEIATATDKLRRLARDAAAGLVGSIVLIANIVSLAALIFSGPLAHGSSTVIWAMLIGSAIAGVWIAWRTSIPPLATGIDSPSPVGPLLIWQQPHPILYAELSYRVNNDSATLRKYTDVVM